MRRGRHLRAVAAALLVLALVVALAALVACAGRAPAAAPTPAPPAPADAVFVGRSGDGAVAVAVAVHAGRATAFVSDGAGLGAWFDGTVDGGVVDLRGADGSELIGAVHGRVLHGAIAPAAGPRRSFGAVVAREPAGLYAADALHGPGRAGWIRFPDGTAVGVTEVAGVVGAAPDPTGPGDPRFTPPRRVAGGDVPAR